MLDHFACCIRKMEFGVFCLSESCVVTVEFRYRHPSLAIGHFVQVLLVQQLNAYVPLRLFKTYNREVWLEEFSLFTETAWCHQLTYFGVIESLKVVLCEFFVFDPLPPARNSVSSYTSLCCDLCVV